MTIFSHSQATFLHIIIPSWQLTVSMQFTHDKLVSSLMANWSKWQFCSYFVVSLVLYCCAVMFGVYCAVWNQLWCGVIILLAITRTAPGWDINKYHSLHRGLCGLLSGDCRSWDWSLSSSCWSWDWSFGGCKSWSGALVWFYLISWNMNKAVFANANLFIVSIVEPAKSINMIVQY